MSTAPKTLGVRIDIETRSSTDIKVGSYRYCEDPDFETLIICYTPIRKRANGDVTLGRIRTLDMTAAEERSQFSKIIQNPSFQKHAYNANFERIALSKWLGLPNGTYIDPENWRCSAALANVHGVFGTLDEVARAVRAPVKKDPVGKRLINFFSKPIPARSAHTCGCVRFHDPAVHPVEFASFERYCAQDVVTEAVVARSFPAMPKDLQYQYEADQRINDRGIRHFKGLSEQAMAQVQIEVEQIREDLKNLTGLDNPNSVTQFKGWLAEQDYEMVSTDKAHRAEALADPTCPPHVVEALELKGAASLSSVQKHKAALRSRCSDGRIRGTLQFYGAHTGREAGRVMQPHNLPRYEAPDEHRRALLRGAIATIAGASAAQAAKGTVRASLVPARGHVFVTADYNAIEARVLAGLAGEKWAEAEFRGDGKIYEATAEQMGFMVKALLLDGLKACGKCGKSTCIYCEIRGRGKVSNLALGYGGGAGALVTMGAEEAGIDCGNYKDLNAEWKALGMPGGKFHEWNRDAHDYPELLRIRDLYRDASPMTTRFWKLCAKSWDIAALRGTPARFGNNGVLTMVRDGRHNRLVLPSGRSIWYRFARSHASDTNPDRIERRTFIGKGMGVGHVRTDTHGGKLTENVTQAVARDVLFDLIMKIEALTAGGWPGRIVLHVHDEVVLEVPVKHADQVLADTIGLMGTPPDWGRFLAVKGEGKIMERYGK